MAKRNYKANIQRTPVGIEKLFLLKEMHTNKMGSGFILTKAEHFTMLNTGTMENS
jgi:hypothetical protein